MQILDFANKLAETRRTWGSPPHEAPFVISQYGKDTAGQSDEAAELARRIAVWRYMGAIMSSGIPKDIIAKLDPPDYVVGGAKRRVFEAIREHGVVTSFDIFGFWLPDQEGAFHDS